MVLFDSSRKGASRQRFSALAGCHLLSCSPFFDWQSLIACLVLRTVLLCQRRIRGFFCEVERCSCVLEGRSDWAEIGWTATLAALVGNENSLPISGGTLGCLAGE